MGAAGENRQSEDWLRQADRVADITADIVVIMDRNGRVNFISTAGARSLECEPEQILGCNWMGLFVSNACREALRSASEKLFGGEAPAPLRFTGSVRPGEGPEKLCLWRVVLLSEPEGAPGELLCAGTKLPSEMQGEDNLQQIRQKLEETVAELHDTQRQVLDQEKHRALTEMASGLAHDFRNSLAVIHGFAEMLRYTPGVLEDRQKTERYLDVTIRAAEKAAETVRDMRTFYHSCTEDEEREEIAPAAVVEDAISRTRPRWESEAQARGIDIEVEAELGSVPPVQGVFDELRQMLSCLLLNAVDALAEGGHIWLRTRRAGNRVVFEVEDDGPGMSPEVRARCLEPFYSTKQGRGAGLGLSVVQGVAQRHGGEVEVESGPSRGTTVRIKLPVAGAGEDTGEGQPGEPLEELRVLVVENDEVQRDMVRQFLEVDGHQVETASDGSEGQRMAAEAAFDLVITNAAMPHATGSEVARAVKKRSPRTPVLLLTGVNVADLSAAEVPDPVDRILSKPLSLQRLREAMRAVTG